MEAGPGVWVSRARRWAVTLLSPALLAFAASAQVAQLPPPLVHLSAVDDTIQQDIRYATARNFTGRVLPGYEAGECILALDVARALARVQLSLAQRGLGLRVYDCYRPRSAAAAMAAWVRSDEASPESTYHHPRIPKRQLSSQGYVAGHSEHSQGIAVDLTLVPVRQRGETRSAGGDRRGDCTAPRTQRRNDGSIDMGTDFDCFDPASHTRAPGLTPEQRAARELLVGVMTQQGFESYSREWWHFRFAGTARGTSFDVPVRSRATTASSPRR